MTRGRAERTAGLGGITLARVLAQGRGCTWEEQWPAKNMIFGLQARDGGSRRGRRRHGGDGGDRPARGKSGETSRGREDSRLGFRRTDDQAKRPA